MRLRQRLPKWPQAKESSSWSRGAAFFSWSSGVRSRRDAPGADGKLPPAPMKASTQPRHLAAAVDPPAEPASNPPTAVFAAKGGCAMRTLTPVLCTSGLAAEAKVARAAGFQVIVGAGDPLRTAELVELAAKRAKFLISFGVAGGLAPHLRPGQVILSAEVIGDDRRWHPNQRFHRRSASWPAASARSKARCSVRAISSPPRRTRSGRGATRARWRSIWKARSSRAPPKPPACRFWCCARSPIRRPANCRPRR